LIAPVMADHPMHRAAKSVELANVCLFLASDLSSCVNGETVIADGGQTRTQANLNATMQRMSGALSDPDFRAKFIKRTQAVTPEEVMGE